MNKKVLIVEDQFVEAHDIQLMLEQAGYEVCGIARSVDKAQDIIKAKKPGLVLLDIFLKGKLTGIDLARQLKEENIAFIFLSANSNEDVLAAAKTTEPYGFIVKPFREKDVLITLEIAQYRHEHSRETKYRRETDILQQLEKVTDRLTWHEKILQIGKIIQQEIPFDYLAVDFDDPGKAENNAISYLRIGFNEYQTIRLPELAMITGISLNQLLKLLPANKPYTTAFHINEDFENTIEQSAFQKLVSTRFDLESLLTYPVPMNQHGTIIYTFYSRRPDTYNSDHISLLNRLKQAISNITFPSTPEQNLKKTLATNSNNKAIDEPGFEGIIGTSHLLLNVLDQTKQVAPFDTAVLILGESGTGKEGIADCIHHLSSRKNRPLIKINCAALPATLIESELFGHEKGAFTGALDRKVGRFEQANKGTIFLDEIGDMPVDLQAKLLRVLQQKEIEPLGGKAPVKIDVRIIAATNKNLEKEVAEGRFRLDLYYRLNVFPIHLPSLRDRKEDIPALADHFIAIYNRKSGKKITGISQRQLRNMEEYNWPGNIRELENLIERSVLLSKGNIIEDIAFPSLQTGLSASRLLQDKTIHENERDHIIHILKKCKGKIWGSGGAAEVLNVPPSTLKSKMKKLGIQKDSMK